MDGNNRNGCGNRRHNAGRRPGEDCYVDISKAIPVWALGVGITLAGMLTGYVTAQDNKLEKAIRENQQANHQQDLSVRELQILMDQMIAQQRATNDKLDKLVDSVDRVSKYLSPDRPVR